jgi:hypothetical protein
MTALSKCNYAAILRRELYRGEHLQDQQLRLPEYFEEQHRGLAPRRNEARKERQESTPAKIPSLEA